MIYHEKHGSFKCRTAGPVCHPDSGSAFFADRTHLMKLGIVERRFRRAAVRLNKGV